jgi:DNA gyrase/topoisomerase IV subunit B
MEETERHRHDDHLLAQCRTSSTPIDFDYETIRARFQQMAFLNKGLSITLIDERIPVVEDDEVDLDNLEDDVQEVVDTEAAEQGHAVTATKAKTVTYRYDGGLVDYVSHLVGSEEVRPGAPRHHQHRGRGRRPQPQPGIGDAVDHGIQRVGPHLCQHDQHPRRRHPRGGFSAPR